MTEFYSTSYLDNIKNKKRNLIISYFVALFIVFSIILTILIIYSNEPFGTNLRIPLLVTIILIIVLFIIYSFIFFTISYGRIKKYYNFLYYAIFSKHEIAKVTVISVYKDVREILGVDFYTINVLCWSNLENDYVERNVYVDCEFGVDNFNKNDVLTIKLNSNYLLGYQKENL